MTALKAHEVARFLTRPDLTEGIFLAYGPDTGLVRETAQTLVRYFSGEKGQGTEVVTFEGSELDACFTCKQSFPFQIRVGLIGFAGSRVDICAEHRIRTSLQVWIEGIVDRRAFVIG